MKKWAIFISSALMLFSSLYYLHSKADDYEKLADKITMVTAKKLEEKDGLRMMGSGGRMMDDVKMMMIAFEYPQEGTIESARALLVDAAATYLLQINENKKIRTYINSYPFTVDNIEVIIYFAAGDHNKRASSRVNIAAASNGRLSYYTRSSKDCVLRTLHEESYEEAVELVR